MKDSVLIIGSGGREHALAWKLAQSPSIEHVYVAPGNAGTHSVEKISNCSLDVKNYQEIATWCLTNNINLVVVGPEDPLANGIADFLKRFKIKCFGPCQKAAQIEASKEFSKQFMDRHQIPTARWKSFTNALDAKDHVLNAPYKALVVKASGLAAGKGVIVAESKEEALEAIDLLKQDKTLSTASDVIVIEELLTGEEVSVLCFSDGTNISIMPPAQDHKRLLDDDKGPNTGGMGAYCHNPQGLFLDEVRSTMQKTIDGMKMDGMPYVGVLYAGLMLTENGPKVLEFNCRFGDPETQVILPVLLSDLYSIMLACVEGTLKNINIEWSKTKESVGIVLVSGGYPGSYPKGKIISGLDATNDNHYLVFHAGTSLSSGNIVTSGGRVLTVVALGSSLSEAIHTAQEGCKVINFEGKFYRSDIGMKAFKRQSQGMTYKSAGVDIDSADDLVRKIKTLTKQTVRPEVCGGIGGFGGIFKLSGYNDPYLVSKVSNISDKLKACQDYLKYEVAGYDLVATAVNEVLCHGAEPLFFLDTYTCGKLDTEVAAQVITGIARGCKESKCTLIGGETAEMPGMYAEGKFDLTAFARGAVEKPDLLPKRESIKEGDIAVGLLSTSLNCSGFSIVAKLMSKLDLTYNNSAPFDNNHTLEEILLQPTIIYTQVLLPLLKKGCIKAAAFFGKDGIAKSISEVLPEDHTLVLDASKWKVPPVFHWVATNVNLSEQDMIENFNLGIDILLVADKSFSDEIVSYFRSFDKECALIGTIERLSRDYGKVKLSNANFHLKSIVSKKRRIGVITSNKGTNLIALIKSLNNPMAVMDCEIALVISENDCESLRFAGDFDIPTKVLFGELYKTSVDMDIDINKNLQSYHIDLICLDGFRKEFSREFFDIWKGKILNIQPSILPAFDCSNACSEALSFGARITGCTVYLVEEEGKFGKILEQDAVAVEPHFTEETLVKKVHHLQQFTYPRAIESFASGKRNESITSRMYGAGVKNADENILQSKMRELINCTSRPGFSKKMPLGFFDLKASGYRSPCLVSGTDGVGTKLKIAQICDKHDTIGIDLVAMCVNDILTHGAEPLIFLQSFDCGNLNPHTALSVISGIAEGCKQAQCALIGSEISELPDIYFNPNQCIQDFENYDVVGYAEGALDEENLLPRLKDIEEGDIIIGISSSGVHSNGYSLVRKIVEVKNYRYQDPFPLDKRITLGEALLTPTKIYVKSLLPLMKEKKIKAAAHITGGGLTENIPRVLPSNLKVVLDGSKWEMPLVLQWIAAEGQLSEKEMLKTFNCGIGMALIIDKKYENEVLTSLKNCNENAATIGHVKNLSKGDEIVEIENFKLQHIIHGENKTAIKKRVGVLISGSGTNLQALIDYTKNPNNCSQAEIVLVISNVADVEGLKRAQRAGIQTKVISHKGYKKRVDFDMVVHSQLKEANIEIVCLAGFMRILSKEFVELWQGRLLNVHPAILPAFKGMNAHKLVLEHGAKITGCTVHFVEPEVDAGAVIQQAAVRVDKNDDEKALQEKVKVLEHTIFPTALELLASGRVERSKYGKIKWNF